MNTTIPKMGLKRIPVDEQATHGVYVIPSANRHIWSMFAVGLIAAVMISIAFCSPASAWLSGYDHRMAITVNNGGSSELNYYQFNFTNDTNTLIAAGHMQASGADCRITDVSDNLIPFWNETAFNASGTKIWANATTLAVGDNTFYTYYGNAAASSVSNGTNTFKFFDDFDYDILLWNGTHDVVGGVGEPSLVVEGDTVHRWECKGADNKELHYSYATDSKCAVYTPYPGNPLLTNTKFGEVIAENGTYYYFGHNNVSAEGIFGDIYLWNSTDKTSWTLMNGGLPILEHSANTSAWNYKLANVGVNVVDGKWHMLIEGMVNGGDHWYGGYSYSNLTELNWTKRAVIVVDCMSCPDLVHVPDRNAFMVFASVGDSAMINAWHVSLADNLSLSSSWHHDGALGLGLGDNSADPAFAVVGSGKENNIIFQWMQQTGSKYQEYSNLSLNAFYDSVVSEDPFASRWEGDTGYVTSIANSIMTLTGASREFKYINTKEAYEGDYNTCFRSKTKFEGKTTNSGSQILYLDPGVWDLIDIICYDTATEQIQHTGGTAQDVTINDGAYHIYEIARKTATTTAFYEDSTHLGTITDGDTLGALPICFGARGWTSYQIFSDWALLRKYTDTEPTASLGAEETGGSGGGAYNITLPLGWSIIGWTDTTDRTAHYMGGLIGSNCTYVTERNRTTGLYVTHVMAAPDEDNFAIEQGWGYFVSTTAETLWGRDT